MKNFLSIFFSFIIFAGCSTSEPLVWHQTYFIVNDTAVGKNYAEVIYPLITEGPNYDSINARIDFLIRKHLCGNDLRFANMNIRQAIDSLFVWKKQDSTLNQTLYDLRFYGYLKECGNVIALRGSVYHRTNDSSSNIYSCVYNIDRRDSRMLTRDDIISDTTLLKKLNQVYFSRYLIDKVISEESLFVPIDELPLPQNISVDSTGINMQYGPNEIAPLSIGEMQYYIPYDDAEPVLKKIVRK
ncbi:MAG TPA: hypothetical protein IAA13_08370 [Candidatus Alistipes merdigallinarum]|nr:hypothetical protein [Candidatus Alistipes merdigallinarum]